MTTRSGTLPSVPGSASRRFKPITIAAVVAVGMLLLWGRGCRSSMPDFGAYENVQEKKDAFFGYLLPHIEAVNAAILADRADLQAIRDDMAEGDSPGWLDRRRLGQLTEDYDLEAPEEISLGFVDRLLRRVDVVAPSLVLAQAANESAWGTSRFARQGNNLFGMRTYEPGTGIVPTGRPAGATWEVAAYPSVRGSIDAYAHNLNTNDSYRQMRRIRADLRLRDQTISGLALAGGLLRYSERGAEYVAIIRSMIRSNDLDQYDG